MRIEQLGDRRSISGQSDDRCAAFDDIADIATLSRARRTCLCAHADFLALQVNERGPAALLNLEHRTDDAVGRAVAVGKGFYVDDDPFTHRDPTFDRRGAHMRQQYDIIE